MNNPLVTVLMPVYNGAIYLKEAIDSILVQTYSDFELLIIDDGSTDETPAILKSYKDERVRVISQSNAGVSAALNRGLNEAKGQYIARADGDDICRLDRLEKQVQFLITHPDYVLVGSDADYMDKNGEFVFLYQNIGHSNEEIQQRYMEHCPFIHSSVIYIKSLVKELGGYDTNAYLFEDYFLWIRLIKLGKVANLEEPLMKIRFNPESVTIDDKDCSPEFLAIKKQALQTGQLTNEQGNLLKKSSLKIGLKKRTYSYHSLLAKKYLWNNYQPKKVRIHLFQAIRLLPFKPQNYLLFIFSFLPKALIQFIYQLIKKQSKKSLSEI
jgi:glycosyltransferase involved in cell wall biosynthesis